MVFIVRFLWEKPINWAKLSFGCEFFIVDHCPKRDELNCSTHFSCDLRWTEIHLESEAQVAYQSRCERHPAGSMRTPPACPCGHRPSMGALQNDILWPWTALSFPVYGFSFLIFIFFRWISCAYRFMYTNFYYIKGLELSVSNEISGFWFF